MEYRYIFKLDRQEELWKIYDTQADTDEFCFAKQNSTDDGELVASVTTQDYAQLMTFLLNTWVCREEL